MIRFLCVCGHDREWHRHLTRSTRCSFHGLVEVPEGVKVGGAVTGVTVTLVQRRCECARYRPRVRWIAR